MVPRLKGELRTPPPPGADLRLAEPWELWCATASTKEGSMAADVRRWGGGVLPAHILQCSTHLGGVGGHGAGTPCRSGGGVWTRLVVGYTWTWASLGFPTGFK